MKTLSLFENEWNATSLFLLILVGFKKSRVLSMAVGLVNNTCEQTSCSQTYFHYKMLKIFFRHCPIKLATTVSWQQLSVSNAKMNQGHSHSGAFLAHFLCPHENTFFVCK